MIRDKLLVALILFYAIFGLIFTGCLPESPSLVEVEEQSLDLQTCSPACSNGYKCNKNTRKCEEQLTAKQQCENQSFGWRCNEKGELVEKPSEEVKVDENDKEKENPATQPLLTDNIEEETTEEETPTQETGETHRGDTTFETQQTETTQLSADTTILSYLPKGVRVLTEAERASIKARNCSAAAAASSSTQATPQSGTLPHESKGGSEDVPQVNPAGARNLQEPTPGPAPFESKGGSTEVIPSTPGHTEVETQQNAASADSSCTTKVPENLCLGEAYARVKLKTAGATEDPELAETFDLVQFSTSAYLTYKLDQNQNMVVNDDIHTLIGGTRLKLNNHLIVRGLDSTGKAALIYQGDGLVSHLRPHPENSQIMMLQHTAETFDPPIINLGTIKKASITLFALTPTSQSANDPLVRHVPTKNMMKLDLSPFQQCIGLYQNTAKTKFPVVLVSQVKTGE